MKIETATQTEIKPLFLVLKTKYFDQILAGTKTKEFREETEFFNGRFLTKDRQKFRRYNFVIFQNGYHKDARKITVEVKKVSLDFCFTIHLGKIIYKNF